MNAVQNAALSRAVKILSALGAQYFIEDPDGNIASSDGFEKPKHKRIAKKVNDFARTGYIETIKAMQPGDTVTFETPPYLPATKFQSAICGQACTQFGKGNAISKKTGNSIELLRVA